MALGDFSPSVMPRILALAEDVFADSRVAQRHNLMPQHNILRLIKEQETATYTSIRPNDRNCEEFDVTWLEESDTEATLSTSQTNIHRPSCTITGEELQSQKKTYKVDNVIHYTVTIKDEDCGNMFDADSKVALGLLQGQKKLISRLCKALPGWIDAFAGVNAANGILFEGNIGAAAAGDTTITELAHDSIGFDKIVPYLTLVETFNKLQNSFLIDGGLLYLDYFNAINRRGTPAGDEGQGNMWDLIRYTQDVVNMNAGSYLNKAFMIDGGSLALPIMSFFPRLGENNEVKADKYIYSLPLAGITLGGQPVYHDVTYEKKEEEIGESGRCQLVHTFKLELKTNLWQAPKYNSDTVTGVITFAKGVAPTPPVTPSPPPTPPVTPPVAE